MTPKATINISIEVSDLGDLERVERALRFLTMAGDGYAGVGEQEQKAKPAKAKPEKSKGGGRRKKKEPEPEPEDDLLGDDDDDDDNGDDDEITEDDLKDAVRERIESDGTDAVKAIFAKFKAKKLSDLKPSQYAKVLNLLREEGE